MRSCDVELVFLSRAENKLGLIDLDFSGRPLLREQVLEGCGLLAMTEDRRALVCASPGGGLQRLHRNATRGADAPLASEAHWRSPDSGTPVLAVLGDGRPLVATRAGLVALSPAAPPTVIWRPTAALADLTLTGVAVGDDGHAAYATAWRERDGRGEGVVVDLLGGEVALAGLGRLAAPRLENGWLWLLDLDRDDLCVVDPESGLCEVVARCPGRVRGLALAGDRALVGLSPSRLARPRWPEAPDRFHGLALIDTHHGMPAEWLALDGVGGTIDDVALIATRARPDDLGASGSRAILTLLPPS